MKRKPHSRTKRTTTKSVLRLADLEHAKSAVLNGLTSPDAQRGYRHAVDEFLDWYCSEPRLAFKWIYWGTSSLCVICSWVELWGLEMNVADEQVEGFCWPADCSFALWSCLTFFLPGGVWAGKGFVC